MSKNLIYTSKYRSARILLGSEVWQRGVSSELRHFGHICMRFPRMKTWNYHISREIHADTTACPLDMWRQTQIQPNSNIEHQKRKRWESHAFIPLPFERQPYAWIKYLEFSAVNTLGTWMASHSDGSIGDLGTANTLGNIYCIFEIGNKRTA